MGTRVVHGKAPNKARGKGQGRGKGRVISKTDNTRTRKRNLQQYQWSVVGRDAFDVAQANSNSGKPAQSSGSIGTRFERGEGGGVT